MTTDTLSKSAPVPITIKELNTENPRWCAGCGDFGIIMGLKRFIVDRQLVPSQTVNVSGIGCSGRAPNYFNTYGVHSIHGRPIPIALGVALARPDLNLFVHAGDGDAMSIGGNHLIHGINKNFKCVFLMYDNEMYALTKNETSPTTRRDHPTNTQPQGSYLNPLNPITVALGLGASFVASTADWIPDHLTNTMKTAFDHPGFAFVHISQRCPHFDPNNFDHKNSNWFSFLKHPNGIDPDRRLADKAEVIEHDPSNLAQAFQYGAADRRYFGLFFQNKNKPRYDSILHGLVDKAAKKDTVKNFRQFYGLKMENLIIIGSGPAAHTAAIYAARARLNPLMFEGAFAAGVAAGGQLTTTTDVENYPGFLEISGPALMEKMRGQSLHCGARIITETVDKVDLSKRPFKVWAGGEEYQANALIISTGATAKRMHLPGEENLWEKGISACAVCDGSLPFFRNKVLAVIGGGDSAVEESTYLTKFASKVLMIVRRDVLRASKVMQERAKHNPKIEIMFNTVPLEVLGEKSVSGLKVKNVTTHTETVLDIGGLFYAIGHLPNTSFLEGQVELDDTGYIKTKAGSTKTNVEGVFAAGDVQDKVYRQAVTSAGTGCMAALDAEHFLTANAYL